MNNEIRTREIQFSTDNNVISGMPIVFNAISDVLIDKESRKMFREIIAPEALSQAFIDVNNFFKTFFELISILIKFYYRFFRGRSNLSLIKTRVNNKFDFLFNFFSCFNIMCNTGKKYHNIWIYVV